MAKEALRMAAYKLPVKLGLLSVKCWWGEGKMKALELRKLSFEDLAKKLQEARNDLFQLRFQNAVNQLKKV